MNSHADGAASEAALGENACERLDTHPANGSPGLFRHLAEIAHGALAPLYLRRCTYVGARLVTRGRPRVLNRGRIDIGDDVVIISQFGPAELVAAAGGRIAIGAGSVIEHGTVLVASKLVEIGDRVKIGAYCVLSDSDSPDAIRAVSCPAAVRIWVGDDVVLGPRVAVMPGSTIGAGTYVLAGSLVTGDIPPRVVAGGNPARPLQRLAAPAASLAQVVAGPPALVGARAEIGR